MEVGVVVLPLRTANFPFPEVKVPFLGNKITGWKALLVSRYEKERQMFSSFPFFLLSRLPSLPPAVRTRGRAFFPAGMGWAPLFFVFPP